MATLLELLIRNNFQEAKKIILEGKHPDALLNQERMTPLIFISGCSCEQIDRIEMARFLVEHGCNVNSETIYGESALIAAARDGHTELTQYLLDNGAMIDACQRRSCVSLTDRGTPLFFALKNGNNETARLLIDRGADIHILGGEDYTPLMCAVENECDPKIIQLLLDKGADCFSQGISGETAYSIAESRHNLTYIELLEKRLEDFLRLRCDSCGKNYIMGYNTDVSKDIPSDIDRISEMGGSFFEDYLPYVINLSKKPLSRQEQIAQHIEIRDIKNGIRSSTWICGACGGHNEFLLHEKRAARTPGRTWKNYDHTAEVTCLSFFPDYSSVAAGGIDGTIAIMDAGTGIRKKILAENKGAIWTVAVSPDGRYLVSGDSNHRIKIWDLRDFSLSGELSGHTGAVSAIAFTRDGRRFASGSWDKTVIIWDFAERKRIAMARAHKGWVRSLAFSHDGTMLASGGQEDGVRLLKTETGVQVKSLKGMKGAYALAFSPDDAKIYAGGWEVLSVFDIAADTRRNFQERFFESVQALALSKDGTRILAAAYKDVSLLDCVSMKKIETFYGLHDDTIECIALGPDDKTFVTGGKDHMTALWKISI